MRTNPPPPKIDVPKRNGEATANAAALGVFDYHVETLGKALDRKVPWRATKGLVAKIRLRLKTFSIDECKLAIENLAVSPHHLGVNDRGTEYCSPTFLFRSDEQVSDWMAKEKHEPTQPETAKQRLQREDAERHRMPYHKEFKPK